MALKIDELLTVEQAHSYLKSLQASLQKEGFEMPEIVFDLNQKSGVSSKIGRCLGVKLPQSYSNMIDKFDFSNFCIGSFQFSTDNDYADTVIDVTKNNRKHGVSEKFVYVASSEMSSYGIILLDIETGCVVSRCEDSSFFRVAMSLEYLLRGLVTKYYRRNKLNESKNMNVVCASVCAAVGSDYLEGWRHA